MTPGLPGTACPAELSVEELLARVRVSGDVPLHVAIIMDGNGRWARQRRLPRSFGHKAGMKSVRKVVEAATDAGIEVLTLFAFSHENWTRPRAEVSALMCLLEEYIDKETDDLRAKGVETHILGDVSRLDPRARAAVDRVQRETGGGTRLQLNLCISYSSRQEITRVARLLAARVRRGEIDPEQITEASIAEHLYTAPWGDPDLLIRTSGEQRISNFLLWQLAYTELHISPVLWPDFSPRDLFWAIVDYQNRERRFGRVTA